MTIQRSVAARDAMNNAFEATVGTSAKLQIRTGAQPATCATAASGTLLCELALPSDWVGASSSGATAKAGAWSGTASLSGPAAHYRIVDNAGTTCHEQGSIGLGSGDLSLDNTNIQPTQVITIATWTTTAGNA